MLAAWTRSGSISIMKRSEKLVVVVYIDCQARIMRKIKPPMQETGYLHIRLQR